MAPKGAIVVLSSRYGRAVAPGMGCYSATKWATEAMAKTLALELLAREVAVVSLDPGVVNTEMLRQNCQTEEELKWCAQQRSPEEFAQECGPFLLSLGLEDTGRNLTAPGSPESYFQTGVPYKDRPAWASGFGAFRASRRQARRYFISGVMLGSQKTLTEAGLAPQNYRQQISDVIRKADPEAVIVDPLEVVQQKAARENSNMDGLNSSTGAVREAFLEVVGLVQTCDVIVSHLPEASMGSAVELWEARKHQLTVLTISPMKDNWTIRSVTDHNFADLADFEANLSAHL
ncbi:unnamed protein product [Effrenium voratum]|nr:unnamed protein product [Effrenium voratum]